MLARILLLSAAFGAVAQGEEVKAVEGTTYMYATNLMAAQAGDIIRTLNTTLWKHGLDGKGMHQCARLCRKEGGGGLCKSWTFCAEGAKCALMSRVPAVLAPAQPSGPGAELYTPKCTSGYSSAAASYELLMSSCKAVIHLNTALADSLGAGKNNSRPLKAHYEQAQPSATACCKLCESLAAQGCTSWSFDPDGWLLDRTQRCILRQGVNPTLSISAGTTSGTMRLP